MTIIIDGYYDELTKKFYEDSAFSPSKVIEPTLINRYRDRSNGRIYVWNGREFLDSVFFADYQYNTYGEVKVIDTNQIYLASPGHRIVGALTGIDEDSCSLTTKLNNTHELSFTINRIVDGQITPYYGQISRLYELYLSGYGWFKIVDEPEIENDGTNETKSITAESGEIELQQYDLVNFMINTGDVSSKEMLATDNKYERIIDGHAYEAFHDQVRFYWDTRKLEDAIVEFADTDGSVEALKEFVLSHTFLIYHKSETNENLNVGCWRIVMNSSGGIEINAKHAATQDEQEQGISYPDYTGTEILDLELQRERELSLLWLILHEHGWNIGYVDTYRDVTSPSEEDRIQLCDKVGLFDIDSQDCYSFITQDIAQYFRCLFIFDTDNYTVNCYNINNVGYDTHIYLSYRNIQNELTRTGQDDLYTVFHVQGDEDLDFTEVNFGEDYIEDISFFLNEKHFTRDMIDKYNHWYDYRKARREQYVPLSIQYREALDVATEIYNRVPVDGMEGKQYSTMKVDELITERDNMIALKRGIEREFTDEEGNIDWDALRRSSEWPEYHALTTVILSYPDPEHTIDYIQYIDSNPIKKRYDFPDSYKQLYPDARLGQIDTAIVNHWIIEGHYTTPDMSKEEKQKRIDVRNKLEYLDNYLYDFDRYGYMYGLKELEVQSKILYNNLTTLSSSGFDESTGDILDEEAYRLYLKYYNGYHSCLRALEVRQVEYNEAMSHVNELQSGRMDIVADVKITNPQFGFSNDELSLLDKYYIHTDYVNDNILITKQSTSEEIINAENQLYLDAMERLYVESHPQYTWSTTQNNLLLMPEFNQWHDELHVGNFVWITFRDDYCVKLRINEITLNPLMIDDSIKLEFTTMTQYRSKRNDYTDLLARANTSTKNQISAAITSVSNRDNTINVDASMILSLLNSDSFSNYMSNIGTSATSDIPAIIASSEFRGDQITSGTVSTERLDVPSIISSSESSIKGMINGNYIKSFINENYVKSFISESYVKSFVNESYVKSFVNDSYIKSVVTPQYIDSTVKNDISISDLRPDDIQLSSNMSIISSSGTSLLTNDGITESAIPNKLIGDIKMNLMISDDHGVYSVIPIPSGSSDTFGSTLADVLNALATRIVQLEVQAEDFEQRISALENNQ